MARHIIAIEQEAAARQAPERDGISDLQTKSWWEDAHGEVVLLSDAQDAVWTARQSPDTSGLREAAQAVVSALPVDGRALHGAIKALALSLEPKP